jgi:sedoheptulokinase
VVLAGLDLGTTTVSAVLIDPERGVLAVRSREHRAELSGTRSSESLQDPDLIVAAARKLLAELEGALGTPEAVGLCGQMHGILYVDQGGAAVSPLYTWLDQRGNRAIATVARQNGDEAADRSTSNREQSFAEYLARQSAVPVATGYGLVTHAVLRAEGGVPSNAVAIATISDYVAMQLAGLRRPVTDPTLAHSIGAYEPAAGVWNHRGLRAAGLPETMLPAVAEPGRIIGYWSPRAASSRPSGAQNRGQPGPAVDRNVPVAVAHGDNPASFLGSSADFAHQGVLSLGTSGQISVHMSEPGESTGLDLPGLDLRPFMDGGYIAVGASLTGGKSYALLRDFLQAVIGELGPNASEKAENTEAEQDALYEHMNELAERAYRELGADRGAVVREPAFPPWPLSHPDLPQVDSRFYGSRSDPDATASVHNLTPANFRPDFLCLGVLNGMVRELYDSYLALPEETREGLRGLALTGNALRRNALLREIVSRYFNIPVRVPSHTEEAAVGAALSAGVAVGAWDDYAAAARFIRYRDEETSRSAPETG